jgi:2',3'-cyclic-nucleotide 2'-phosphodiesterase (5'-nucleotidase family)
VYTDFLGQNNNTIHAQWTPSYLRNFDVMETNTITTGKNIYNSTDKIYENISIKKRNLIYQAFLFHHTINECMYVCFISHSGHFSLGFKHHSNMSYMTTKFQNATLQLLEQAVQQHNIIYKSPKSFSQRTPEAQVAEKINFTYLCHVPSNLKHNKIKV